jgi:protein SCO1/2
MTNRPKKKNHKPMRRCGLRSIIILLAIAIVSATAFVITAEPRPMHAQRRVTRIQINDFALTDQNSTPFEFKNLAGKVVVVAFAYTTCPDVCPLITASLRQVQSGLTKEERKHVRLMTVTTDPEIDSPKVLTAYAKRYGAEFDNWSFLTGNLSVLEKIWQNFGVGVERKGRGLIDHTPLTAVVDQKKLMRFAYIGPSPDPKAVLADVRAMLREH